MFFHKNILPLWDKVLIYLGTKIVKIAQIFIIKVKKSMDRKLLIQIIAKDINELSTLSQGFLEMDKIPTSFLELGQSKAMAIADEFKQLLQKSHENSDSFVASKVSSNIFEEHKPDIKDHTFSDELPTPEDNLSTPKIKEEKESSIELHSDLAPEIEAEMDAIDAEEDVEEEFEETNHNILQEESFATDALNALDERIGQEIVEVKEDIQEGYQKVSHVANEVAQEVDDYFAQVHKKSDEEIKEFQETVVNKARFLARKLRGEKTEEPTIDTIPGAEIQESEVTPVLEPVEKVEAEVKDIEAVEQVSVKEEDATKTEENASIIIDEPLPESIPEENNSTPIAGRQSNDSVGIQENYQSEPDCLNARLSKQKIKSIGQSISFVDSFMYQRELFQGDGELMRNTFDKLDAFHSLEEALDYLQQRFAWKEDQEGVKPFYTLLERRY